MSGFATAKVSQEMKGWYDSVMKDDLTKKLLRKARDKQLPAFWESALWQLRHAAKINALGGNEGAAVKMVLYKLDKDGDKVVSTNELESAKDTMEKAIDGAKDLCLNWGVIGALTLSVVLPCTFEAMQVHEDWLDENGEVPVWIEHVHMALLMISICFAGGAIMSGARTHMALSQWCTSLRDQMEFIEVIGLMTLVVIGVLCIVVTLLFGVARAIFVYGPVGAWGGLVILFWIGWHFVDMRRCVYGQVVLLRGIEEE
mmetsp:Transcript_21000/g.45426  ORF Transcript_21000/g.45426 Transcript_21000/m.45426 type:complete len:257 (-) Transcript_21000:233-1003(-)